MKIFPKDKYGTIPAILGDGWSIVWSWPQGKMVWFFWNWNGSYRIGPLTFSLNRIRD